MTNTLGVYDPIFYANEALIWLKNRLGMASRVHRRFEEERGAFRKGQVINIRRPAQFTAQDAPGTAEDIETETIAMTLNNYRVARFKVPDNEYAFTGPRLIQDHIKPAAYALADDIESKLLALYKDVPWHYDLNATPGSVVTDVTGPYQVLFDNKVPMDPENLFYVVNGALQNGLQSNSTFGTWDGAGPTGEKTQASGALGHRFGMNFFASQKVPTHTPGTMADSIGALVGAHSAGATSLTIDGLTASGTVKAGDTLVITGNTQRYAITADATANGSGEITVSITPPLVANAADNDVTTIRLDAHVANMAFHRDAFALVTAPLPADVIREAMGAKVETVTDEDTGISLRSRLFYLPDSSEIHVALDVLYAVKTLNPNLAVRACG